MLVIWLTSFPVCNRGFGCKDVLTIQSDMGDEEGCKKAVDETVQHFERRERLNMLLPSASVSPVRLGNFPLFTQTVAEASVVN